MRVNMITPWRIKCGIADYTKLLIPELKKKIQVEVIEIKNPETKNPLEFYRIAKDANRNCDIIHVQHEYGIFGKFIFTGIYTPVLYLFLDKNKKIVTSLHEVGAHEQRGMIGFIRNLSRSMIDYFIFRYSTILHVHTENAKKILMSKGVAGDKIAVIPHGAFIKPDFLDKEESKKKLGLQGKRIITIFGFVHRNKGHDLVIDVLPKLDEDVVVLIAGGVKNPAYAEELKKKVRKLRLQKRVIFLGYISEEEIPIIFSASDAMVLPYRKITQSGVLNYGMAYEVPTLASDLLVFKEIKDNYECIEVFKSEDKQDLELKLKKLLGDREKAEELRTKGKRYVEERGTANIVKKIIEFYLAGHEVGA